MNMHSEDSKENQENQELNKIQEEIQRLRGDIEDSYYRVPKEQFEQVTVNKISKEVSDQINKKITSWRNWIGAIFLVLSFLGISQGSKLISDFKEDMKQGLDIELNSRISELSDDFDRKMDKALASIENLKEELEEEQASVMNKVSSELDGKVNESTERITQSKLEKINQDMESVQKTAIRAEYNLLKNDVDKRIVTYGEAIEAARPLLESAIDSDYKDLVSVILDGIIAWTFNLTKYEELDKIRRDYGNTYNLSEVSWANIAIADMILYVESNSPIYKKRCREVIELSLEELPSYGVPHAISLILFMVEYDRSSAQQQKSEIFRSVLNLFQSLKQASRGITTYECYNYLKSNQGFSTIQNYINQLYELFPKEMRDMELTYNQYLNQLPGKTNLNY